MSLHRSLKTKPAALNQHRNVLTRTERIQHLRERGVIDEDASPFGLLKVANRKSVVSKKKKKEDDETAEGDAAEGTEAAS